MATRAEAVLRLLADGRPHSGQSMAARLGVTRAAVWKHIRGFERWGLQVAAVRGRGYRLSQPIDWLDAAALAEHLRNRCRVADLQVLLETGSTNQRLLEAGPPPPGRVAVCVAEFQTAGRGRRGRAWSAPFGSGLCLSVAWGFASPPPDFGALALAAGVVVRRVLRAHSGADVMLKWPNDLALHDRKLGGILVEAQTEAHGHSHVVVGLGLNVALPVAQLASLCDWPAGATDLASHTAQPPSRNVLAGEITAALAELLEGYPRTGFGPYREEWRSADCLAARPVNIVRDGIAEHATALGIDDDGALRVRTGEGRLLRLTAGEVTLRARE